MRDSAGSPEKRRSLWSRPTQKRRAFLLVSDGISGEIPSEKINFVQLIRYNCFNFISSIDLNQFYWFKCIELIKLNRFWGGKLTPSCQGGVSNIEIPTQRVPQWCPHAPERYPNGVQMVPGGVQKGAFVAYRSDFSKIQKKTSIPPCFGRDFGRDSAVGSEKRRSLWSRPTQKRRAFLPVSDGISGEIPRADTE